MLFPDGAFNYPPLTPPPLSAPRRGQRGEPRFGYFAPAALLRRVRSRDATVRPDWQTYGRSQRLCLGAPRLAATPARNETCLVHGRPQSGRRWGSAEADPFTTTAGEKSRPSSHGGDATLSRSLSKKPETKSRPPSLPPAGGKEGRGDDWGVVKSLARENPKTTKQKSPEGEKGRQ